MMRAHKAKALKGNIVKATIIVLVVCFCLSRMGCPKAHENACSVKPLIYFNQDLEQSYSKFRYGNEVFNLQVLVTGGAGFIGSHIVDAFLNRGYEVVVVDNLSTGKLENLNPGAKFYQIDIRSPELCEIFEKEHPDYVDHHAAQIDVRKSAAEPAYDAEVNVVGTINVLENCVTHKVKKVVFASTGGAIYGEPEYLPVAESHPIAPLAPYGLAKHIGELYLDYYHRMEGLSYVALRYGNVYGPRQDPHGEAGVVAIFINIMLKDGQPVIYGDGTQSRDYIYIEDVVQANVIAMEKDVCGAFNIGTGIGTSVNELYRSLGALLEFEKPPLYLPPRIGEVQRIYLSAEEAKRLLGWEPQVSLVEGLQRTIKYFKRNI